MQKGIGREGVWEEEEGLGYISAVDPFARRCDALVMSSSLPIYPSSPVYTFFCFIHYINVGW